MEIPFVGGAYTSYSTNINAQRSVNLFLAIDKQDAKNPIALFGTPGLTAFGDLGTGVVRGVYAFGDYLYAVRGANVYSVNSSGTETLLGTISTSSGNVFFADNGTEVIIVDGTDSGYLITANVLAAITDTDFPAAASVTFQDGYFIVTKTDTGTIYISGLYDGTSWDALDFASAEANPDDALRVISNAHDLWIFGEKTAEVYYNSGNTDFPFERIPGAVLELGLGAIASAVKINGVIYWLSEENRVVRTRGYQFDTVSTTQIDYQISTYSTTSDAKGFSYQVLGHIFYVLIFPTEDKTWVFDVTTEFWHEWQSYAVRDDPADTWGRHRASCIAKYNGNYIVGDYENGLLYTIAMNTYTDNTNEIRRIRTSQVVNKGIAYVIWHRMQVDFESGVGDGVVGSQGLNPQASLDWSDDGGHTWSNKYLADIGAMGEYTQRVVWRRLGKSRNRILRITMSDPVKVVMLGAYAELEECVA